MKTQFYAWRLRHPSSYFFFIFTLICSVLTIAILIINYFSFRKSQNVILSNYAWIQPIQDIEKGLTSDIDSLLSILDYSPKQKLNVHKIIDESIKQSSNLIIKEIGDDSIINSKIKELNEETRSLIELEYNKIQHEYQSLQIWCGILTVIFLIFSFYSMFKADDLVNQGKRGLRDLEKIKDKGESLLADVKNKNENTMQEFSRKYKFKLSEIELKNRDRIENINALIKAKEKYLSDYIIEKEKNINDICNDTERRCNDLLNTVKSETNTSTSALDAKLSLLQQQMDSLNVYIESINKRLKDIEHS
ncbi:hypothetical protein [uncultured Alistipes sp.]|uniref:hypothetical protein n=1 Tax=uncultured Alistipes sp. TaxID=538949 RepID=UPI002607DD2E|nr:hypothetical protein [uncultured Alistipes sp.]